MNSKQNLDCYLIGIDDDRCQHDIENNIYPCDKDSEYVSYDNEN